MFSAFKENQTITETLRGFFDRKLSPFSGAEYAYSVVSKINPSEDIILSSDPNEWIALYRTNNSQLTDPVVLIAFRRTSPFAWDENITLMSDLKFTKIFSPLQRVQHRQWFHLCVA